MYQILDILKIFSSKTKLDIILHLYTCKCNWCVNDICNCLNQKQANISKHIMELKKLKIVTYKKQNTYHHLKLHHEFINEFQNLIEIVINKYESNSYKCVCCNKQKE